MFKGKPCIEGEMPANSELTLFSTTKSLTCTSKAVKSFDYVSKPLICEGLNCGQSDKFKATEIQFIGHCNDTQHLTLVSVGKHSVALVRPVVVNDQETAKRILKLYTDSALASPDKELIGGYKVKEAGIKLGEISQPNFKDQVVYFVRFNGSDETKRLGDLIHAVVIKDKILEIPSEGHPNRKHLMGFTVNTSNYLEVSAGCGECDSWSGLEVFEIVDGLPKLIHTSYDLLNTPSE